MKIRRLVLATASALIAASVAAFAANFTINDIIASGSAPAVSSCGTSPAISGTDLAGVVTVGTPGGTTCTVTFATAKPSAPKCVVTWQTNLASMVYTVSASAISITQTGTSANKINYVCVR